jgi:ABC-2 type transport system ATP-binding protein
VELACADSRGARTLVARQPGIGGVEAFGDRLHVKVDDAERWVPRLRSLLAEAGIEVHCAAQVPPSVEDIFLHLARGDRAC